MKKIIMVILASGVFALAGFQLVNAGPGWYGGGPGYGNCQNYRGGGGNLSQAPSDEQSEKAFAAFQDATREIRRNLAVKDAELQALMLQDNPDEKKAAALTGEIYDLRTQLDDKADEAGISRWRGGPSGPGGPNFDCDGRGCNR